jgi:hypothetical protein
LCILINNNEIVGVVLLNKKKQRSWKFRPSVIKKRQKNIVRESYILNKVVRIWD